MFEEKYRIFVLILSTACLSMMLANILTLNFTILCMTEEKSHLVSSKNSSGAQIMVKIIDQPPDYHYTPSEKSILFGVIAAGALVFIFPLSWSIGRFGCRKTFTIVGLFSALLTALCPLAAHLGVVSFVVVRFLQGVGYAACMQVVGCVTASWARLDENGLFNGALTGFIQLAPVITMPMSGVLCSSFLGWRSVYYTHALITAILMIWWWFVYRDNPEELSPKKVSVAELKQIQNGKIMAEKKRASIPIKEIFQTPSVWAVWIAAIGNMYSIQMIIVFAPTFIREVLKYPLVNVGFASAVPTLLQFFVKLTAGSSSDKIKMGETAKVKIFNTLAFVGMGGFLLLLALVASEKTKLLAIIFLIANATMLGFNTGGFFKSATLIGRQHAHFVNAVVQCIMCTAMLTMPFYVYALTPDNSPGQWAAVFVSHAILLFITNAIFCVFGQGVAAEFAKARPREESTDSGTNLNDIETSR